MLTGQSAALVAHWKVILRKLVSRNTLFSRKTSVFVSFHRSMAVSHETINTLCTCWKTRRRGWAGSCTCSGGNNGGAQLPRTPFSWRMKVERVAPFLLLPPLGAASTLRASWNKYYIFKGLSHVILDCFFILLDR